MSNLHAGTATGATNLVTTAETAAYTSPPTNYAEPVGGQGGEGVQIHGSVNVTAGTGTTGVQIRVRQGAGTGGAQVGNTLTHTLAAGASASIPYDVTDTGDLQSLAQQYTVTVQQVAATGNGTVNQASMSLQAATSVE